LQGLRDIQQTEALLLSMGRDLPESILQGPKRIFAGQHASSQPFRVPGDGEEVFPRRTASRRSPFPGSRDRRNCWAARLAAQLVAGGGAALGGSGALFDL
jgi:hypothetical protein